jgi:hypothetical protein
VGGRDCLSALANHFFLRCTSCHISPGKFIAAMPNCSEVNSINASGSLPFYVPVNINSKTRRNEKYMPKDMHQRAAELHDLAAHAHRVAATHHDKEDHQTGHEHSRQALEHSSKAFEFAKEAHRKSKESAGKKE